MNQGKENAAYNVDSDGGGGTPPPSYEDTVIPKSHEPEEEIDPWDLVMPPDTGKQWKGINMKLLHRNNIKPS